MGKPLFQKSPKSSCPLTNWIFNHGIQSMAVWNSINGGFHVKPVGSTEVAFCCSSSNIFYLNYYYYPSLYHVKWKGSRHARLTKL